MNNKNTKFGNWVNKEIKGMQADPNQISANVERSGDTSKKASIISSIDGRKLRRKDRPHQFNTKISNEIHEGLYRIVIEKKLTITEIIEQALRDYFKKMGLTDLETR